MMDSRRKVGISAVIEPDVTIHTQTLLRGLTVALNHFASTKNIQFIFAEDYATRDGGHKAANVLLSQGIEAVIGPFSSESLLGGIDQYKAHQIPVFAPAATVCVPGDYELLFRLCPSDDDIVTALSNRVSARGFQHVAVDSDANDHSERLASKIKLAFGQRFSASKLTAEAIVYSGRLPSSRAWLGALRQSGCKLPIFLTDDAAAPDVFHGIIEPGDVEIVGIKRGSINALSFAANEWHRNDYEEPARIYFLEVITAALVISEAMRMNCPLDIALTNTVFHTPLGYMDFSRNNHGSPLACEVFRRGDDGSLVSIDR